MLFLGFVCFVVAVSIAISFNFSIGGYSIFIEFKNAYGIREGTNIRMRGINIGYVKKTKIDLNSILVLVHIQSRHVLIPQNSIIETNQTGLLNDTVIDIIPLDILCQQQLKNVNVLSKECYKSKIICHLNYLQGERGLNYDDLIRAATRISQRFDDPSLFHIFYLFLQNSLELSDGVFNVVFDMSNFLSIFYGFLRSTLVNSK
uniref:hypothetical protein n=1 Tax=Catenella fusiformis TaxID=3024791 RepID=UPI0027DAB4D0|nr:hypothetical protein REQ04_pgp148 [Catenella fusiformis]WCH57479.1 hypothetical protein [Catenella fusiformis]